MVKLQYDITFVGIGNYSVFHDELELDVYAIKDNKYYYPEYNTDKTLNCSVEEYKTAKKKGMLEIATPAQILKARKYFYSQFK